MVSYPKLDMNYSTFDVPNKDKSYTTSDTLPADALRDNEGGYVNPREAEAGESPLPTANRVSGSVRPSRDEKDFHGEVGGGCCARFEEFCNNRTEIERWFVSVIIALILLSLGFVIAIIVLSKRAVGDDKKIKVCGTPDCVVAAGEILSSLDLSVSPCEDFHQYVCGGWKENNPLPPNFRRIDTFYKTREIVSYQIKEMLEKPDEEDDPRAFIELKKAYRACTNEDLWKKRGIEPLIETLIAAESLPPMLDPLFNGLNYDWRRTVIKLRKYYYESHLISVDADVDFRNVSQYAIFVGPGYLPTNKDLAASNDTDERDWYIGSVLEAGILFRDYLSAYKSELVASPLLALKDLNMSLVGELKNSKILHDALLSLNSTSRISSRAEDQPAEGQPITEHKPLNMKADGRTDFDPADYIPYRRLIKFIDYKEGNLQRSKRLTPDISLINLVDLLAKLIMEQQIKETWDFYVSLAKAMADETSSEMRYNPMTIKELQEKTDSQFAYMNWLEFIQEIFKEASNSITEETVLYVTDENYFKKLFNLLNETPNSVIANAILMQFALSLGSEVSPQEKKDAIISEIEVEKHIGRHESRAWSDCASKMNNFMGFAMSALYVRTHIEQAVPDKRKIESLVDVLHYSLVSALKSDPWMDLETRSQAVKKAQNIIPRVAYPEDVLNTTDLDLYYQSLPKIDEDKHFENMMRFIGYFSYYSLQRLNYKPSRKSWISSALTVNGFYDRSRNSIHIPLGIIRSPYFRRDTVESLMYGAMGSIVSHEILHGFDINGRKANWQGTLTNWWTNASLSKYLEKAKCFEQQYGLLPLKDVVRDKNGTILKVDGVATNAENIADSEGLSLAWSAFQESKPEVDHRLIGMENYSSGQLFFISYGQIWCNSFTEEGLRTSLKYDVHTPPPFRVNGAVRNHPGFAQAFNCSLDSKMVSNVTCSLWL